MKNTYLLVAVFLIANNFYGLPPQSVIDGTEEALNGGLAKHEFSENEHTKFTQCLQSNGISFTPNKGQIANMDGNLCPDILFNGKAGNTDIYLRKTGISYVYSNLGEVLHKIDEQVEELIKAGIIGEADEKQKKDELLQKENIRVHRVDMDFARCNENIRTKNEDEIEGYTNYYYAHCPEGITHLKQYNKVTYKNIYNGIDIVYRGAKQYGIKYDLIVQPHADPGQIELHWKGAESIHLNHEGALIIKTALNEFTETLPRVYQNINGKIVDVKAEYIVKSIESGTLSSKSKTANDSGLNTKDYLVTFKLGTTPDGRPAWNPMFPLVIDPYWATYCGGNKTDVGTGIATDNSGNVVITGTTMGGTFPTGNAGGGNVTWQGGFGGAYDVFVVKFDPSGNRLWATYYGGSGSEFGEGIATDNTGNVLVTGYAGSPNFPVFTGTGGYSQTYGGGAWGDAFLLKFDASGIRQWATYYGGSFAEQAYGVATDNANNIVITGRTNSSDFPVWAGFQMLSGGVGYHDAFVVKFNSSGVRLWATYFGGNKNDVGVDIAIDNADNVSITGITDSPDLPIFSAFQASLSGGLDSFIAKFDVSGGRTWATYYGGNVNEGWTNFHTAGGITTDNANNIIITGGTRSGTFPTGNTGGGNVTWQGTFGGVTDAFVVKFDPNGSRLWATYYGGNQYEWALSVTTDAKNNIYVLMEGEDVATPNLVDACTWQPIFNGGITFNTTYHASEDQLIVKFSSYGEKLCATYMGGAGEDDLDEGGGIAIFNNSLYISGTTEGGYPVTAGSFQTDFGGPNYDYYYGGQDAFVSSLCTNICEGKTLGLNYIATATSVCANVPVTFTPSINNSCDTTGYKYSWTFTGGTPSTSIAVKPEVTFTGVGTHNVKLVVTTPCKKDSLIKASYITVNNCGCMLSSTAITTANATCSGKSDGSASVIISNGSGGPYTFSWSNGATGTTTNTIIPVSGLPTGAYTVTVSEGACVSTAIVAIVSPPPLSGQFTKGAANCGSCGCKEWLLINAAGGTSPYSYSWPDGYTSRYKNQLCPGAYSINIKDKNGCSINVSLTIP